MLSYYCHRNLYDKVTLLEYWFLKLNVNKGHCKVSSKSVASLSENSLYFLTCQTGWIVSLCHGSGL